MEYSIPLADGLCAHVRHFPAVEPARGTLVLVHGALEHGAYYEHVAARFVSWGWNAVVPDLRGLGQSGGPRMHVTDFEQYLSDLDRVLDDTAGSAPVLLLGHSMGGLIAIRYAQTRPHRVQGLILSAPLIKVALPINPIVLFLGWQLSRILPRFKFRTGIRSHHLSRNEEFLARRREDPLVRGKITAGWFRASEAAMKAAQAHIGKFPGPILLLQGMADAVTNAQAALEWGERAGAEIHRLPGQLHALLQEPEREQTLSLIKAWIELNAKSSACSA